MLLGVVVEMESTATNLLIHDVFWIMYWKPQQQSSSPFDVQMGCFFYDELCEVVIKLEQG